MVEIERDHTDTDDYGYDALSDDEKALYEEYLEGLLTETQDELLANNPDIYRVFYTEFTSRSRGRKKRGRNHGDKVPRRDRDVGFLNYVVKKGKTISFQVVNGDVRSRKNSFDLQPDQIAIEVLTHLPEEERDVDTLVEVAKRNSKQFKEKRSRNALTF